jgi:flavin-dependent dehydrogenase
MKKTETGIIGGGLAGLSLAILLARQGKEVMLWEKSAFPFHRVCGEYISKESLPFLMSLLPDFNWNEIPHINTLVLSSPSGKILKQKLESGGIGISRYRLDAALADMARTEGVNILENCRILDWTEDPDGFEIRSADQTWRCNSLFLASGKGKIPGETAGKTTVRRNFVGVKYHIRFDHPADEIQLHNFRNGYCGMSRIEDGISCLCYMADSAELRACGNDVKTLEAKVLSANPHLQKIFSEAEFLWPAPKVISGLRFGERTGLIGNAVLLGDAAGSIAPLTGNGMSMALRASYGLGLLQEEIRERRQRQAAYISFRKEHFRKRIAAGSEIQDFFGNESITEAALGILRVTPSWLRNKIIGSTHGKPFG